MPTNDPKKKTIQELEDLSDILKEISQFHKDHSKYLSRKGEGISSRNHSEDLHNQGEQHWDWSKKTLEASQEIQKEIQEKQNNRLSKHLKVEVPHKDMVTLKEFLGNRASAKLLIRLGVGKSIHFEITPDQSPKIFLRFHNKDTVTYKIQNGEVETASALPRASLQKIVESCIELHAKPIRFEIQNQI